MEFIIGIFKKMFGFIKYFSFTIILLSGFIISNYYGYRYLRIDEPQLEKSNYRSGRAYHSGSYHHK